MSKGPTKTELQHKLANALRFGKNHGFVAVILNKIRILDCAPQSFRDRINGLMSKLEAKA